MILRIFEYRKNSSGTETDVFRHPVFSQIFHQPMFTKPVAQTEGDDKQAHSQYQNQGQHDKQSEPGYIENSKGK